MIAVLRIAQTIYGMVLHDKYLIKSKIASYRVSNTAYLWYVIMSFISCERLDFLNDLLNFLSREIKV